MNLNIDTIILIVLIMDDIIIPDKNPIDYLITPITPYFLCDHFVSTEVHKSSNKFIEVYCGNSNKKVIGFDIFNTVEAENILDKDAVKDKENMKVVYDRVDANDLTLESVKDRLSKAGIPEDKYKLVKGDVEVSLPVFLHDNPGFRISLLYIDVDLDRPTYNTLTHLWDRVLPGGAILFDEYEYHKFSESVGVERFLKERQIEYSLISTDWISPTAYIIKKGF